MHEVYVAEFFSGNSPDLREAIEKKSKCPKLPFKISKMTLNLVKIETVR